VATAPPHEAVASYDARWYTITIGKKEKALLRLRGRPKDYTFVEAVALAKALGATVSNKGHSSGSRTQFRLNRARLEIHEPHPRKELLPYQIRGMIEFLKEAGVIE
jgi:hypothetical protein